MTPTQPPGPPRTPRTAQPNKPEDLIQSNEGLVRHIVGKYLTRAHPDFDDVLQEGRLALLRAEQTYDPAKAKWSTYAGRCIQNAVTGLLRNQPRHEPLSEADEPRYLPPYLEEDPDPEYQRQRERIALLLDKLPAQEARVIRYRYGFEGEPLSQRETARYLRLPRSTVVDMEARALRRLRALYSR